MKFIGNRNFLLVSPKKPFIDWINAQDDDEIDPENILSQKFLYMIEDFDDISDESVVAYIRQDFKPIFLNELESWYMDESIFPNLTFANFRKWFHFELVKMCFDTLNMDLYLE